MAFDDSQYPKATSAILGYMEGHRLSVTYFNLQGVGGTDIRTNIADSVSERHVINTAYIRINNFEITLSSAWTFDYDPDTTESSITGEALFYPGVNPLINDVFLTNGGDNKLALFKITAVIPLSWRNRRAYQVKFSFYKFPATQDLQLLAASTIQTLYFDKINYLDDTVCVLEEDVYQNLLIMRQMRTILARYYISTFYNQDLDTYFPPSGPYDPYVVRFMAAKCPYDLVKKRPRQLQSNVEFSFLHSIWQRLLDRTTSTWDDVWSRSSWSTFVGRTFDVNLTPLVNRAYVTLIPNTMPIEPEQPVQPAWDSVYQGLVDADPGVLTLLNYEWADAYEGPPPTPTSYVLSSAFYTNTVSAMTPFEQMLAAALTNRCWTDSQTLINNYLNTYRTLTLSQQFYRIPLYLHMIDITMPSLARVI